MTSLGRVLDLSYNRVSSIQGLEKLVSLKKLFLACNKISTCKGLPSAAANLSELELGGNQLREISDLDSYQYLEKLFLGKNKISVIQVGNLKLQSPLCSSDFRRTWIPYAGLTS